MPEAITPENAAWCPSCKAFQHKSNVHCIACGAAMAAVPKKKSSATGQGCGCLLLLIAAIWVFSKSCGSSPSAALPVSSVTEAPPPPPPPALQDHVHMTHHWRLDGFGNVMIATFRISNDNDIAVKDIEILCRTSGRSGTELSSASHTIYDIIAPHKTRTFTDINMGFVDSQSARAGCDVVSVSKAD